jgi:hypothetical protein
MTSFRPQNRTPSLCGQIHNLLDLVKKRMQTGRVEREGGREI